MRIKVLSTSAVPAFEHKSKPLLPRRQFYSRVTKHALMALGVLALSLGLGIVGYMATEGMAFIDAMLNASMLLGGMGPVDQLHTNGGKLFASFYSLFSGMIFLVVASIIIAPLIHRLLHRFHLERKSEG
jgi:hypothetical protein